MIPQFFDVLEIKFQTEFKWDTNERGGMLQRMRPASDPPLGATTTTAASGGLREELLGQWPARCECNCTKQLLGPNLGWRGSVKPNQRSAQPRCARYVNLFSVQVLSMRDRAELAFKNFHLSSLQSETYVNLGNS